MKTISSLSLLMKLCVLIAILAITNSFEPHKQRTQQQAEEYTSLKGQPIAFSHNVSSEKNKRTKISHRRT